MPKKRFSAGADRYGASSDRGVDVRKARQHRLHVERLASRSRATIAGAKSTAVLNSIRPGGWEGSGAGKRSAQASCCRSVAREAGA